MYRPVVRPGNQRLQPPPTHAPFVFPPDTPPDSAGEESNVRPRRPSSSVEKESLFSAAHATPQKMVGRSRSHRQKKPSQEEPNWPLKTTSPLRPAKKHTRSHSFSTVDEHTKPEIDQPGTFKVIIHRPSVSKPNRPVDTGLPVLEIPIPHYRLGTPQFGAGGRAILRSSVYTRSSDRADPRASNASNIGYDRLLRTPSAARSSFINRRHSEAYQVPLFKRSSTSQGLEPRASLPSPSQARYSIVAVASHLYDFLCARPDDPTVVRYAPESTRIIAATPSRLVAHITSPSFLDYELLSDFFLTFRSFLQPDELVSFLVSRLRWAVDRPDDFGRIVRVRTFVALRHWILNYFVDDFLADLDLRKHFCELVNGVYEYLRNRSDGGAGDIKIIGELKKCWRRTVGLYWDNPDPFVRETADDEIVAGGELDAIHAEGTTTLRALTPAPNDVKEAHAKAALQMTPPNVKPKSSRQGLVNGVASHVQKPSINSEPNSMPYSRRTGRTEHTDRTERTEQHTIYTELASDTSPKVLSCSMPVKSTYRVGNDVPLYPHPVPVTVPISAPVMAVSTGPSLARAPMPYSHKAASTISARDSHQPSEISKGSSTDLEVPSLYIVPGSLVRGVLYQPDSPYFDVPPASSMRSTRFASSSSEFEDSSASGAGRSGTQASPGVKKFFGSVRKAFRPHINGEYVPSDRSLSPYDASFLRTTTSTPDAANHGPVIKKSNQGLRPRPQVRIDLLCAQVGEKYKQAVEAGAVEEHAAFELKMQAYADEVTREREQNLLAPSKPFDRSLTVGSRSIVIVDDTQPEMPTMSGALRPYSNATSNALSEGHVNGINRLVNGHQAQRAHAAQRDTSTSIDSVLLGKQERVASAVLPVPPVYEPSGIKRSNTTKEGPSKPKASQVKRFTNSSGASTLRRFASYHSGDGGKVQAPPSRAESDKTERRRSGDSDEFVLGKPPVRQLRRRPGGDLKAVDKVDDLAQPRRHRRNSTGSSIIDSIALPSKELSSMARSNPAKADGTSKKRRKVVEIDEDGTPRRKSISLIQTHSSQPNLRPSFEAEVAKLAALPDDEYDDGGVDAALLKLEGRYEKKTPSSSPEKEEFPPQTPTKTPKSESELHTGESAESRKHRHHKEHVEDIHPESPLPVSPVSPLNVQSASIHHASQSSAALSPVHQRGHKPVNSVAATEDSYSSIPLLQRGVSSVVPRIPASLQRAMETGSFGSVQPSHSASSSAQADGVRIAAQADRAFNGPSMHESFLLDDDGSEGDPYDLGPNSKRGSHGVRSFLDDGAPSEPDTGMFMHPLRHPDTPPVPKELYAVQVPGAPETTFNQGLPTPGMTPVVKNQTMPISPISPLHPVPSRQGLAETISRPTGGLVPRAHPPAHLPFILAYDAQIIAEQFTLIEKDALDEIDWRELIELRWTQASPAVLNWVDYLKSEDPRGVDLVIARFNLVVKWLLSEIVLTELHDERVRCLIQYIHIAEHCRRFRNFATMYQITIALLSADCARLKRTWERVPDAEMQIFKELEKIVQPIRNFQNLRKEMETGVGDEGCIPFIGIYTRDLVYNSQKPSVVESPPLNANEPLVNFERHQTAAAIVKSLLRLLEASSKYNFQIEPQVITKCLWMSALPDEEITRRSRLLEQ